jgi:PadR family transcriptional regulator, regulatory protein PadR
MSGDVRITLQTLQVLRILLNNPAGEHYGLEISRTSGLPTGSIYPILTRLETAGWITSAWEEINESEAGRRRRRYYRLTSDGTQQAQEAVLDTLSELAGGASQPLTRRMSRPLPNWTTP